MELEHHRDLAHEFPQLKPRIHALKLESAQFRRLYREYQSLDNEIHRIEQDIETPSDAFTEALKLRRVWLKDYLYGLLTGRIQGAAEDAAAHTPARFPPRTRVAAVGQDWAARGYSCHEQSDPPGGERLDIVHEHDSLVTVLAGQLEVMLAGVSWVLEPGDELSVPASAVHTIRNSDEGTTHWLFGCARQ